jgi:endonuclease YncB( thermonuclease family)
METAASPRLPPGTKVKVELDVEPVDKYGRQLAYLYRRTVVNQPEYA